MRAALTEFLTLGKLGAISLGLTRSQVHEALGEPEGWLNKYSVAVTPIWKYLDLQVAFEEQTDRVILFGLYFNSQLQLSPPFVIEGYFPTNQTTLDEFKNYLETESIIYCIYEPLTFGDQLCLTNGISVHILFGEQQRFLNKILLGTNN